MNDMITLKESQRYPGLFVRKYHKKVFWNNLWNTDPLLLESRGHVFDSNGNMVVAPFTKVFNRGENGTDIPSDHMCVAVEKINGFMAAATYVPAIDDVIISTTGSLDSKFVDYAREKISKKFIDEIRYMGKLNGKWDLTYIFEIVHKNDPHIISQDEGAYLIGIRYVSCGEHYWSNPQLETDMDIIADDFDLMRPMWYKDTFANIIKTTKSVKHEGFVVYDQDGDNCNVLKIKSPYYLSMKAIARSKNIFTLDKRRVDEEFYDILDFIKNDITPEYWESLTEQSKLDFLREFYDPR